MNLSTLQWASVGALALIAGSADAGQPQWIVADEPAPLRESPCAPGLRLSRTAQGCGVSLSNTFELPRPALDLSWKTKRTASDVLTELLDVDGIRVVAERHLWDRPEVLALRHDFDPNMPLHLYCTAGIDRAVYLDSRVLSPTSARSARRLRSVGMMAEIGAAWRLTEQFNIETDIHWMDSTRDGQLMRTDTGWVSGDPVGLTLSLVWRGH